MSHERLLVLLIEKGVAVQALMAAMGLHRPTPEAVFTSDMECATCQSAYPCQTMQAIEGMLS